MIAGKNTALVLLKKGQLEEGEDASEEEEELVDLAADSLTDSLDSAQLGELTTVVQALDANKSQDPKVKKVYEIVTREWEIQVPGLRAAA
jgi:hypothetical protein